jgi:hypothetical protein
LLQPYEKRTFTYNNTWSPIDPNGLSFAEDAINVTSGDVTFSSSNTYFNTLTINPGASVTVAVGASITGNSATTLNSTSSAFSSLLVKGNINGVVNYNRYTALIGSAVGGTNDLISAPVVDQTFGSFATANTNLAASNTLRAFAPYNTTNGAYENYDITTNANTLLTAGKGYRAATTDGSTLKFTGTVRTDQIAVLISDAGDAWNLIGNPYPSYLNFASFFNENNRNQLNSDSGYQAVYGYNGNTSNSWTIWNLATIADPAVTELIAPGQAFFVKAKTTGGTITFTPAMQTTGNADDFILGKQTNTAVALAKIRLSSETASTTTDVYFIEGATKGLDIGYDAADYLNGEASFSIFTHLAANNTGVAMGIQTLSYSDFNDVVIPLGINADESVVTISIDERKTTLPDHINVYLEDGVKQTITLLNNTNYTFTNTTNLKGTGRFFLRYSSKSLTADTHSFDDVQIYNKTAPKEIIIKGLLKANTKVSLYDTQGRLVLQKSLNNTSSTNTIDITNLSVGVYLVKVHNESQTKTQKLFIR